MVMATSDKKASVTPPTEEKLEVKGEYEPDGIVPPLFPVEEADLSGDPVPDDDGDADQIPLGSV
jgi:hypothetical protein